jgi:predicted dienelactone hydrolase
MVKDIIVTAVITSLVTVILTLLIREPIARWLDQRTRRGEEERRYLREKLDHCYASFLRIVDNMILKPDKRDKLRKKLHARLEEYNGLLDPEERSLISAALSQNSTDQDLQFIREQLKQKRDEADRILGR